MITGWIVIGHKFVMYVCQGCMQRVFSFRCFALHRRSICYIGYPKNLKTLSVDNQQMTVMAMWTSTRVVPSKSWLSRSIFTKSKWLFLISCYQYQIKSFDKQMPMVCLEIWPLCLKLLRLCIWGISNNWAYIDNDIKNWNKCWVPTFQIVTRFKDYSRISSVYQQISHYF